MKAWVSPDMSGGVPKLCPSDVGLSWAEPRKHTPGLMGSYTLRRALGGIGFSTITISKCLAIFE